MPSDLGRSRTETFGVFRNSCRALVASGVSSAVHIYTEGVAARAAVNSVGAGPNIARVTKGASRFGIDRPPRFRRYIRVSPVADPMGNECDHPPAQRELTDLARAVVGDGLHNRGHLALTERSARRRHRHRRARPHLLPGQPRCSPAEHRRLAMPVLSPGAPARAAPRPMPHRSSGDWPNNAMDGQN